MTKRSPELTIYDGSIETPQIKKPLETKGLKRSWGVIGDPVIGGGGGNRTRVREPSAVGSTCLARSLVVGAGYPRGREGQNLFSLSFNGSPRDLNHRDLMRVDARIRKHKHLPGGH